MGLGLARVLAKLWDLLEPSGAETDLPERAADQSWRKALSSHTCH